MISVVIPSYNHAEYIGAAIESVLAQSYRDLELIIIDDGSTDATRSVLSRYAGEERVTVHYQENQGAAAALNRGLTLAKGDYLTILNSDDLYHPRRLERLLGVAEEEGGGDLVLYTELAFIDRDSNPFVSSDRSSFYQEWLDFYRRQRPLNHFIHGNLLTTSSNLFVTRKTFEKIGGFVDLRYCHDWEWVLRASRVAKVVLVAENLLSYRLHESNTIMEPDLLRHCLENAYAFSSLVKTAGAAIAAPALLAEIALFAQSKYFHSFMVVALLDLRNSLGDEQTLALIKNNGLAPPFEELLAAYGPAKEAFFSSRHVKEVVDSLYAALGREKEEIDILLAKLKVGEGEIQRLAGETKRQGEEICRLIATSTGKAEYIRLLENSVFYRARLRWERLRRGWVRIFRKPHLFFGRARTAISTDLGAEARYLYRIDSPVFDERRQCLLPREVEKTRISGWLGDMVDKRAMDTVFLLVNGIEYTAEPLLRPDVAKALQSVGLAASGFVVEFPTPRPSGSITLRLGLLINSRKVLAEEEFEIIFGD